MNQHPLIAQLLKTCEQHELLPSQGTLVAAVSGGVDSMVMLHALHLLQAEYSFRVHVATADHGLRGKAGQEDADYVEAIADEWGIPCSRATLDVPGLMESENLNLEAAARQARYTFLLKTAYSVGADRIAIAHNLNDQAETVLMNIIRGTGLHGLRGMLPLAPLSEEHLREDWQEYIRPGDEEIFPEDYTIIRPLFDIPRAMIRTYAEEQGIQPRYDVTNMDTLRARNAVRHDLIPVLSRLNPNIEATLCRLSQIIQGDVAVLEQHVEQMAAVLLEWTETTPAEDGEAGEAVYLDRHEFGKLLTGTQRGLLRKVIFDLSPGVRDVSFDTIERARDLILNGHTNAQLELPEDVLLQVGYDEVTIGYGGDPVYPHHLPHLTEDQILRIDPDAEKAAITAGHHELLTYWVVEGRSRDLRPTTPLECTLMVPEGAILALRTWREGDRFKPFGMGGHSQKLADTFTNLKVPVYFRQQVPLVTINDEIAWFVAPTASGPQSRIAETFAVQGDVPQAVLRLRWQTRPLLPLTE
ncbi:MAG: tRNA lysidine(34) synthetase TilS [Chloroflexi bacterium]|nr:tRNA lysidine(34) synthetase TilS [Chloroflexota bacterium]